MAQRQLTILATALVGLLAVFLPLAQAPFVYEDLHVSRTPTVSWAPADVAQTALPGRILTVWSLEQTSHDAGIAHLTNVGLHLLVTLLVGLLAYRLAGETAGGLAVAMHAVHPMNVQAVAYVSGRAELLLALGAGLAAWAALGSHRWRWVLVAAGLVIALGAKETGLVVAPLVLLTVFTSPRPGLVLRPAVPLGLGVATGLGLAMARTVFVPSLLQPPDTLGGPAVSWSEFVVRQIGLTGVLLAKVVWPTGFSIDYDALALAWPVLVVSAMLALILLLVGALAWTRPAQAPLVAWSAGWLVVSLAPRLLTGSNEFIALRHLYVPLIGVTILCARVAARWLEAERVTSPLTERTCVWRSASR